MKHLIATMLLSLVVAGDAVMQVIVDRVPAPTDLEAFVGSVDVIVQATITDAKDVERGTHNSPWMRFTATIDEVVKFDQRLSDLTTVVFYVLGHRANHETGFPPFRRDQRLLLYLKWADGVGGYVVAHGPDGAYEITDGKLHPLGRSVVAQRHAGRRLSVMVPEIRSVVRP